MLSDCLDSILLAASLVAYSVYTVAPEIVAIVGSDRPIYDAESVTCDPLRYLLIVASGGDAGEPRSLALRVRPLLVSVAFFVAFNPCVLYEP